MVKLKKNYWIVGYGEIAQALVDLLTRYDCNIKILTTKDKIVAPNEYIVHLKDYSEQSIHQFFDEQYNLLDIPDYIFLTCGLLHDTYHLPEKTITTIDPDWLIQSIYANVMPSLLFSKYITMLLNRSIKLRMICFSARVGSISDNKLGGWHSYRMSKAMLNMLVKNISIEWKIKSPESIIIGYHPGTVASPLSKPFTNKMDQNNIFTPTEAATFCLNVTDKLTVDKSGCLLDWDNQIIQP